MSLLFIILFFAFSSSTPAVLSATFTIANNCNYDIWPGLLSGAGTAPLETTGFSLSMGQSRSISVPASWSGRVWARTLCSFDSSTSSKFTCLTGDCGSGTLECSGSGAAPPASLAEFTLNGDSNLDFYDVSLVDGYNLPVLVAPSSAACTSTGCLADLNPSCPSDLKVIDSSSSGVACKSACEAFGTPEYCCSGQYGNPNTCKPSAYSQFFKNACPRAYSYAYDDATSTFTCPSGGDYVITFCPSQTTSQKNGQNNNPQAVPLINDTMVYTGDNQASSASIAAGPMPVRTVFLAFFAWRFVRQLYL